MVLSSSPSSSLPLIINNSKLFAFFLIDQKLGTDDEAAEDEEHGDKILFFYPDFLPLREKISQITYCEAILDFSSKFEVGDHEDGVSFVSLADRYIVYLECEPKVWMVAIVGTSPLSIKKNEKRLQKAIQDYLRMKNETHHYDMGGRSSSHLSGNIDNHDNLLQSHVNKDFTNSATPCVTFSNNFNDFIDSPLRLRDQLIMLYRSILLFHGTVDKVLQGTYTLPYSQDKDIQNSNNITSSEITNSSDNNYIESISNRVVLNQETRNISGYKIMEDLNVSRKKLRKAKYKLNMYKGIQAGILERNSNESLNSHDESLSEEERVKIKNHKKIEIEAKISEFSRKVEEREIQISNLLPYLPLKTWCEKVNSLIYMYLHGMNIGCLGLMEAPLPRSPALHLMHSNPFIVRKLHSAQHILLQNMHSDNNDKNSLSAESNESNSSNTMISSVSLRGLSIIYKGMLLWHSSSFSVRLVNLLCHLLKIRYEAFKYGNVSLPSTVYESTSGGKKQASVSKNTENKEDYTQNIKKSPSSDKKKAPKINKSSYLQSFTAYLKQTKASSSSNSNNKIEEISTEKGGNVHEAEGNSNKPLQQIEKAVLMTEKDFIFNNIFDLPVGDGKTPTVKKDDSEKNKALENPIWIRNILPSFLNGKDRETEIDDAVGYTSNICMNLDHDWYTNTSSRRNSSGITLQNGNMSTVEDNTEINKIAICSQPNGGFNVILGFNVSRNEEIQVSQNKQHQDEFEKSLNQYTDLVNKYLIEELAPVLDLKNSLQAINYNGYLLESFLSSYYKTQTTDDILFEGKDKSEAQAFHYFQQNRSKYGKLPLDSKGGTTFFITENTFNNSIVTNLPEQLGPRYLMNNDIGSLFIPSTKELLMVLNHPKTIMHDINAIQNSDSNKASNLSSSDSLNHSKANVSINYNAPTMSSALIPSMMGVGEMKDGDDINVIDIAGHLADNRKIALFFTIAFLVLDYYSNRSYFDGKFHHEYLEAGLLSNEAGWIMLKKEADGRKVCSLLDRDKYPMILPARAHLSRFYTNSTKSFRLNAGMNESPE